MIALKKFYGDELLRLALVLSLLKLDPNEYLEIETHELISGLPISNGSNWSQEQEARTLIRPRFIHPKSLDNILINYERRLFEELNSLGRYVDNNGRTWNNRGPIVHTYLLDNVATNTAAPVLAAAVDANNPGQDGVSADENVAHEVKVTDEDTREETQQLKDDGTEETKLDATQPDAVVTLSTDYFSNHSESDIFAEIATRSFDVNEFLVSPGEMQIKKEPETSELLDVHIKKERDDDDLYNDNAIDDFIPYFASKAESIDVENNSVFEQNMADLHDYEELFEMKDIKPDFDIDMKQHRASLEQYLIENTPLDGDVYELAPMFEDELVLDVKRQRASTSSTTPSSSGVSEMDISVKDYPDVKLEPDEGHHTGDELTQEVSFYV